jgi:hypothetical protein
VAGMFGRALRRAPYVAGGHLMLPCACRSAVEGKWRRLPRPASGPAGIARICGGYA